MVKKISMALAIILLVSSCGFFGDTSFPIAVSEKLDWLLFGEIRDFYILDNGSDLDLLVLVIYDGSATRVAVFDTSLNLRGFMEDGKDGVITDGIGFVDHSGNFVIGQTQISSLGTSDPSDIVPVPVPNVTATSMVYSYVNDTGIDYYIRLDVNGSLEIYDDTWTWFDGNIMPNNMSFTINQNDEKFSDIVFAEQSGDLYVFTKKQLFDHADNVNNIVLGTPSLIITNPELTDWVTRCSRGYFVSTYNGDFILYGNDGNEIKRIENRDYSGEIVTIDYDCEYYYFVNRDKGMIIKERFPF